MNTFSFDEFNENHHPLDDFDGLSPAQMHQLLYHPLEKNDLLTLYTLGDDEYRQIPLLNQIRYLCNRIAESGKIKLTKKGYLPVKLVADIHKQGFLKDELIESGFSRLYKETDSNTIHLTHILIQLMKLAKKRNGVLSLTKKGEKIIQNPTELLQLLFETFCMKFNWAYFDGHEDERIAQLGFVYSLFLLNKYGSELRSDDFYAEKYFCAFPVLLPDSSAMDYIDPVSSAYRCYSLRTFNRFLDYFGMIELKKKGAGILGDFYVSKTPLFNKWINFEI